jgi:hypothetical protein
MLTVPIRPRTARRLGLRLPDRLRELVECDPARCGCIQYASAMGWPVSEAQRALLQVYLTTQITARRS